MNMKILKQKKKQVHMSVRQDLTAVENKIETILEIVNETKEEISDVKSEVRGLKNEMNEVRSEVHGLKSEMSAQTKLISQLPTREELTALLNMKQQLDRVREIIRERLKVEV